MDRIANFGIFSPNLATFSLLLQLLLMFHDDQFWPYLTIFFGRIKADILLFVTSSLFSRNVAYHYITTVIKSDHRYFALYVHSS